ncbi:MAG: aminotransferase class IV [Thermodesulfovibrionales bacterium]
MYIFLDGVIVPESQAVVSVYDHGFLYGDGVYETMRSYGGIVFMVRRHMDRLARSGALIRLKVPEAESLIEAVDQTLEANKLSDAYIRITLSRGKGPIGLDPGLCGRHTLVVIAEPFREYPGGYYEKGVQFIIAKTRRNLADAIDPKIKSLNFLNNILAKIEAKERGAYEAVMLNAEGFLTEGTVCNIFFVSNGILCTPSVETGILDGITRELVIGIARRHGLRVEEGMFYPNDLLGASEVFFTNTTAEVMPVAGIEDVNFEVGEITRTLRRLYRTEVGEYIRKNRR